jgi:hypothetical protein
VVVEVCCKLLVGRLRNVADLGAIDSDEIDGPLFVLKSIERVRSDLGRGDAADQRRNQLAADGIAALLSDKTLFGVADLPNCFLEALLIELSVKAAECGILADLSTQFVIRNPKPHSARAIVERRLSHKLGE